MAWILNSEFCVSVPMGSFRRSNTAEEWKKFEKIVEE